MTQTDGKQSLHSEPSSPFAKALERIEDGELKPMTGSTSADRQLMETIRSALRFADKAMQEPSEAVVNATGAEYISSGDLIAKGIWKAMCDAMLKEIER